jgi:hypothetical protein
MKRSVILVGLVVGAVGTNYALGQSAGVVQFAAGDVKVVSAGGSERAGRKGIPVSVGDTLLTAPGALAQLKMGDGAIVVVQPASRLTVAEFHYAGAEDGTEKVRYRLDHGGFRAVTGAIGRTNKKNYLIETPIAHMGVRGTDHESYYFAVTGPVEGDGAKPGAYNKVNTGRTFIRTGAGEVEIDPNQVGFVASAGEVPVILPSVPGFFNRSVAPRSAAVRAVPAVARMGEVEQDVDSADGQLNSVRMIRTRGPRVAPGNGNGPLVGFTIAAGQGNTTFGGSGNGVAVERNGAAEVTGSGPWGVNWSSWLGNVATVSDQATSAPTHFIDSTLKTPATALAALGSSVVQATYSYNGSGPGATTGAGAAATINSLNVGVNFSQQTITSYQLNASGGGTTWTAGLNTSASHTFADFTGSGGIRLAGSCMGCAGNNPNGSAASGSAHGAFVGPQAEGMTTSFGLSASGKSLSGAALLNR